MRGVNVGAPPTRLIVLGATGSIGRQTLEVVDHLNGLHARGLWPRRFEIVGLAGGSDRSGLERLGREAGCARLAIAAPGRSPVMDGVTILSGPDAAERLVRETEADLVVGAIVGSAGIAPTMAAVELGRDVALANKETLVAAGELVVSACARSGAALLPVDSEHSGVWQALSCRSGGHARPPWNADGEIARIVLTASGGALRDFDAEGVARASVEDALAHPTWSMGPKVTVDSASLTNKALELIEAHWLFGVGADRLGAVVHPTSTVHAFVHFADGSVIAQLGAPDMRTPIQYALCFPERPAGLAAALEPEALGVLEFRPVDDARWPAVGIGLEVIRRGGTAGAIFNAANEAAVEAFLAREIAFGRIGELVGGAIDAVGVSPLRSLADVREAEREARRAVSGALGRGSDRPVPGAAAPSPSRT